MGSRRLASLLRNLLHKQREERKLDAEVRAHERDAPVFFNDASRPFATLLEG